MTENPRFFHFFFRKKKTFFQKVLFLPDSFFLPYSFFFSRQLRYCYLRIVVIESQKGCKISVYNRIIPLLQTALSTDHVISTLYVHNSQLLRQAVNWFSFSRCEINGETGE